MTQATEAQTPDETQRMCVACRKRRAPAALLRLAAGLDGVAVFDVKQRLTGRGAWLCCDKACLDNAIKKDNIKRALQVSIVIDRDLLVTEIEQALRKRVADGLGLLRRMGQLFVGRSAVEKALLVGSVLAVLLARDLADRSARELINVAESVAVPFFSALEKDVMGSALGRDDTGIVGIQSGRMGEQVVAEIKRLVSWIAEPIRGASNG